MFQIACVIDSYLYLIALLKIIMSLNKYSIILLGVGGKKGPVSVNLVFSKFVNTVVLSFIYNLTLLQSPKENKLLIHICE